MTKKCKGGGKVLKEYDALLVGVENGNGDTDRDGPVSFWVSFYLCPSVLFTCFYHAANRDTAHFFNLPHCRPAAHISRS